MRGAGALLLLCGCNQVFGLDPTHAVPAEDAQYFDAPADAPFSCPGPGSAPQFSRLLHQIPQNCVYFETSVTANLATAYCFEPAQQIAVGPPDGPLVPLAGLEEDPNVTHRDLVRLAPEGDELFYREWLQTTTTGRIRAMRRIGDTFEQTHDVAKTTGTWDSFVKFGRPSAAPLRHMFVQNATANSADEMLVDAQGVATPIHTYTPSELGAQSLFAPPALSADGLHITFYASIGPRNAALYSSRMSIDGLFQPGIEIEKIPPSIGDLFMTDDCGRLYFSAIGNVLWVQRN